MERQLILNSLAQVKENKARILYEVNHLFGEFGFGLTGCLRLEDVYSTRKGQRYGPFGPYYYLYTWKAGKLEKKYLGKNAGNITLKKEIQGQIRQLQDEYKRLLKEERKLFTTLSKL